MLYKIGCTFLALSLLSNLSGQSIQQISLAEAYTLLEARYPSLQNEELRQQIYQTDLQSLNIARFPSLHLKADGRLQSESTQLRTADAMLPFRIDQPLVALKSYLEADYVLLDGGRREAQQKVLAAQLGADQQQYAVERYSLRERVNQLFLAMSLLRAQTNLLDLTLQNIRARQEVVAAGVSFGTVLESEQMKLEVQRRGLEAQKADLRYRETGMRATLADLLGVSLSDSVVLAYPPLPAPEQIPELDRPEQKLFQLQGEAILAQSELLAVERQPKLRVFAQAGIGYPNPLNILDNSLSPYGLVGVAFSWKITDWKKRELDQERLRLQALQVANQGATFEFNQKNKVGRFLTDVQALQQQLQEKEEIARLQAAILAQMAVQLDEGVIGTTEYLLQLNEELAARQQLLIHQIELQQIQLRFWNERGIHF